MRGSESHEQNKMCNHWNRASFQNLDIGNGEDLELIPK